MASTDTSTDSETLSAFARRHGFTRQRAHALKGRGLPILADGRVNPQEADAWLEQNLDRDRRPGRKAPAGSARDRKEAADAELKELELARRRGELVERAAVETAVFERARLERDGWLTWAAQAAPKLAAALGSHETETFTVLDRLVRERLQDLSDATLEGLGDAAD